MKDTPIPREEFEEWLETFYDNSNILSPRSLAWEAWQAAQKEVTAAREELAELKAEYGTWWAQKRIAIDELKEVTEQRDRLAEERKPQWLNIESAPKDGTYILATDDGSWKGCFICHWDDVSGAHYTPVREFGWATHYDDQAMQYDSEDPTHWMPLPSLPKTIETCPDCSNYPCDCGNIRWIPTDTATP